MLAVVLHRQGHGAHGALQWQRPLVQLGRISYSLFLVHFPVLLLVNGLVSAWVPVTRWSPWFDGFALLAAVPLSIGAAVLLHRWVESRPATWRAVLLCFVGMLACGALVAV